MSKSVLRALLVLWGLIGFCGTVHAEPAKVVVGTYINKINDVSFKDSRFALDFYIWFRWKAEGKLADYKPLESFEIVNGRIDGKGSIVEKKIGDENYASARVTATIFKNWELRSFPFDRHQVRVHVEDSSYVSSDLVFQQDVANSRLGDEIALPGWVLSGFASDVVSKAYKSNYGDTSLPTDAQSSYSRLSFGMQMIRDGWGTAIKLLGTAIIATMVAFVVFAIRPVDVDPRFGLGVGALFAVAASAFVVAAAVPDSGVLTVADHVHLVSMAFIFASIVQSAICLKWDEAGEEAKWKSLDRRCLLIFPALYVICVIVLVGMALR